MRKCIWAVLFAVLGGLAPLGFNGNEARAGAGAGAETGAASRGWVLSRPNASVTVADLGGIAHTYTSDVQVSGLLQPDGHLELTIGDPPEPDTGFIDWDVFLEIPAARLTAPRMIAADEPGVVFRTTFASTGCGIQDRGWIDVRDIALDDRGRVTRMWFRFQTECAWWGASHGEVRWGYGPTPVAPAGYTWPTDDVDEPGDPIIIEFPTSVGWHPTIATVEGRDARDFEIVSPLSCPPSGPCRLAVRFSPQDPGHRHAVLLVDGGGRTARLPLDGRGRPGLDQFDVYAPDTDTITPQNGRVMLGLSSPWMVRGEAYADSDDHAWGLALTLPSSEVIRQGRTYTDTGDDRSAATETDRRVAGYGYWVGCAPNDSEGVAVVRQFRLGPGDPAIDVELDLYEYCNPRRARFRYGARDDVTPPVASRSGRVSDEVLRWDASADAVRSVVRVRRGGAATDAFEGGELIHSGSAESVRIPARYRGRSASYAIFTLDATGNVSPPELVRTRGRTRLGVAPSARSLRPGERLRMNVRVADAGWGYRSVGHRLVLDTRRPDGRWSRIMTATTNARGRAMFRVRPRTTRDYRVRALATGTLRRAASAVVRVKVE